MQIEITSADACFISRLLTKEKMYLENRVSLLEDLSQEFGDGSLFQDTRVNEIADNKRVIEQINRLDGDITKGLSEENQA
jgi:hypothetical protein